MKKRSDFSEKRRNPALIAASQVAHRVSHLVWQHRRKLHAGWLVIVYKPDQAGKEAVMVKIGEK